MSQADNDRMPSGKRPPAGAPGWVKVLATVIAAVVVLLIIVFVVSGGDHGPGRHTGEAGEGSRSRIGARA